MFSSISATTTSKPLKPGDQLRKLRSRVGITAREVEELSRRIASEQGNEEFAISHGRIIQVENNQSTPSIYKLCSLSAIYGIPLSELMAMFVDLDSISQCSLSMRREETGLVKLNAAIPQKEISFPSRCDSGFNPDHSGLISRMVREWAELPAAFIQQLNLRSMQYGVIGLNDYTMYPLLKPGSFVQIDPAQRRVLNPPSSSEYERPIYFLELRDSFLCGWCEMQKNRLVVVPHPLSSCKVRVFDYPAEIEIVGRVVAIAARVAPPQPATGHTQ